MTTPLLNLCFFLTTTTCSVLANKRVETTYILFQENLQLNFFCGEKDEESVLLSCNDLDDDNDEFDKTRQMCFYFFRRQSKT